MQGTVINHGCYIGDSVIGENVDVGAGTIIANWRHDGKNVKSVVKSILTDTGRLKFGTVIGDNAKIGINTSIYPGRKVWPNAVTVPGENIRFDVVQKKY